MKQKYHFKQTLLGQGNFASSNETYFIDFDGQQKQCIFSKNNFVEDKLKRPHWFVGKYYVTTFVSKKQWIKNDIEKHFCTWLYDIEKRLKDAALI